MVGRFGSAVFWACAILAALMVAYGFIAVGR